MKPTHFRPHVGRNPLSFSDDPFDPWRPRTSRAGEFRSPRAVGNLPAKRSASQDSTNRPTILGLSAESLEGVEVGFGDCPARDRPRLAKEAFQTLLVPIIAAQESRPASDRTNADIRKLVKTMAEANVGWGAPRIHGELQKLGIEVSERTVSRLMPKRITAPSQTWRTFLDNHAKAGWA